MTSLGALPQSWSGRNRNTSKEFWLYAFKSNLKGMKDIYAQDPQLDINYLRYKDTPLDLAIENGNKSIVSFLLGLGAKFSSKTQDDLNRVMSPEEQERILKANIGSKMIQLMEKEKEQAPPKRKITSSPGEGSRRATLTGSVPGLDGSAKRLKPPVEMAKSSGSTDTLGSGPKKTPRNATKTNPSDISLSRASSSTLPHRTTVSDRGTAERPKPRGDNEIQEAFVQNLIKENAKLKADLNESRLLLENAELKHEVTTLKGFQERDAVIANLKEENRKLRRGTRKVQGSDSVEQEMKELKKENESLKQQVVALEKEISGLRSLSSSSDRKKALSHKNSQNSEDSIHKQQRSSRHSEDRNGNEREQINTDPKKERSKKLDSSREPSKRSPSESLKMSGSLSARGLSTSSSKKSIKKSPSQSQLRTDLPSPRGTNNVILSEINKKLKEKDAEIEALKKRLPATATTTEN